MFRRIKADVAERSFLRAPGLVGGRLKFNAIDPDRRSSEIRPAVEAVEKAGVIRRVFTSPGGLESSARGGEAGSIGHPEKPATLSRLPPPEPAGRAPLCRLKCPSGADLKRILTARRGQPSLLPASNGMPCHAHGGRRGNPGLSLKRK